MLQSCSSHEDTSAFTTVLTTQNIGCTEAWRAVVYIYCHVLLHSVVLEDQPIVATEFCIFKVSGCNGYFGLHFPVSIAILSFFSAELFCCEMVLI